VREYIATDQPPSEFQSFQREHERGGLARGVFYFDGAAAAEGDGECVGDVGGIGRSGEVPSGLDGALDLGFFGVAVAGNGLLDAVGGELLDGNAVALGDEENDAAGVAHEDCGAGAGVVGVELFYGADGRLVFKEEGFELAIEFVEARGESGFGVKADDAGIYESWGRKGMLSAQPIDDAVTGELEARIDAEDAHIVMIIRIRHDDSVLALGWKQGIECVIKHRALSLAVCVGTEIELENFQAEPPGIHFLKMVGWLDVSFGPAWIGNRKPIPEDMTHFMNEENGAYLSAVMVTAIEVVGTPIEMHGTFVDGILHNPGWAAEGPTWIDATAPNSREQRAAEYRTSDQTKVGERDRKKTDLMFWIFEELRGDLVFASTGDAVGANLQIPPNQELSPHIHGFGADVIVPFVIKGIAHVTTVRRIARRDAQPSGPLRLNDPGETHADTTH